MEMTLSLESRFQPLECQVARVRLVSSIEGFSSRVMDLECYRKHGILAARCRIGQAQIALAEEMASICSPWTLDTYSNSIGVHRTLQKGVEG